VIRNRIGLETHHEVFAWVLKLLAAEGLLKGKTLGIDATTLEANAPMRSIVRKDTCVRPPTTTAIRRGRLSDKGTKPLPYLNHVSYFVRLDSSRMSMPQRDQCVVCALRGKL
jgi:hypothetical protein